MSDIRYEIIEGSKLKARFVENDVEFVHNIELYVNNSITSIEDYFIKYWNKRNYERPRNGDYYNFVLYYDRSILDYRIYSINNNNYDWETPRVLEKEEWKGYMTANEDNVLSVVYSDIYSIIRRLSPFNTIKGNRLLIIDLVRAMYNNKFNLEFSTSFYDSPLFVEYMDMYIKIKKKCDALLEISVKFLEAVKGKTDKEVKNILRKKPYSATYFRILYIHKIDEKEIKTYLSKHENLHDLLK